MSDADNRIDVSEGITKEQFPASVAILPGQAIALTAGFQYALAPAGNSPQPRRVAFHRIHSGGGVNDGWAIGESVAGGIVGGDKTVNVRLAASVVAAANGTLLTPDAAGNFVVAGASADATFVTADIVAVTVPAGETRLIRAVPAN